MLRLVPFVSAAALVCFLAGGIVLARLERSGPPHADLWLEGDVPATLHLPGQDGGRKVFAGAPPEGERPPALVLMHGFAGDRRSMSGLARRLAGGGVAVLTIDLAGHGRNRNPYRRSDARGGAFEHDVGVAVDFLRTSPLVDGFRVAVAGHSMGASAALDYATRDSAVAATVLISGGRRLEGPFRPANALFLYAAADPNRVRERVSEVATALLDGAPLEPGQSRGRPERGDAVRVVEIAGADHVDIVSREATVRETLDWLHLAFGMEGPPPATPSDPRMPLVASLGLAFLAVLPGLGLLAGLLAPARDPVSGEGRWSGLAWLGAALVLTLPLLVGAPPIAVVPLVIGDVLGAQFALAGLALLSAIQLRRPELLAGCFARPLPSLWAALVTLVAVTSLLQPFGMVLHGLTLTPERALAWLAASLSFLPLALSFNLLLRRGPTFGATLSVLCGRLVILAVLVLGIRIGALVPATGFLLPSLALLALVFEAMAAVAYARSHNVLVIALVDAGWLAFVTAAILPTRI